MCPMSSMRPLAALALSLAASFASASGCSTQDEAAFPGVPNLGGRPLGSSCAFDSQCESNRCNADPDAGTCGECVAIQALGQDCTGPHQGCSSSAVCKNGVCQSLRKIEGQECALGAKGDDQGECDVELFCAQLGDISEPGRCIPVTPVGGSCADEPSRCPGGAYCNPEKRCVVPLPGACVDGYYCEGELHCGEDGLCHEGTLAEGDACGIIDGELIDEACSPGLVCHHADGAPPGTTCIQPPGLGEPCAVDDCAEGLFCFTPMQDSTKRYCDLPRTEGEPCRNEGYYRIECAEGLECRAGLCQTACP